MNIKKSLSFLGVLLAIAFCIFGESIKERLFGKSAPQQKEAVMECMCYCSEICAPRIPDKPGDNPFVDPETGICFCQERDRVNYEKNGCYAQNNAKIFNSCCDQMRNQPINIQPVK
jgi:hypothetical protein